MGILTTDEAMERALKQTPVHLDLRRFEHARIDAGLSKQTVAAGSVGTQIHWPIC